MSSNRVLQRAEEDFSIAVYRHAETAKWNLPMRWWRNREVVLCFRVMKRVIKEQWAGIL